MSLYRLIDEESDRQPVSRLCRTLGVTRSGFYDYRRQPLSDRALADWLLTEQIRGIFDESAQTAHGRNVTICAPHGTTKDSPRTSTIWRRSGVSRR